MRSAVIIVALLTIVAGVALPATATSPSVASLDDGETQTALDTPTAAQQSTLERSPQTDIFIELHSDRSADWRIEMRYELETENETAGFEEFAQEYEAGTADVGLDADLFERVSETAEEQTGRSMAIENVTATANIENDTGIVVLAFTWTNFLEETDDGLRLGDAFSSGTDATWLTSLQSNQNLTIQTPPRHAVSSTSLPLENNAVVIEGPRTFESTEQLTVSYVSTGGQPPEWPWDLIIGGIVAVAVVLGGTVVYLRRRPTDASAPSGQGTAPNPDREPPTPETTSEAEGPGEERPPTEPDDDGVDVDLLSDEERVELLLEQKGGRMKQANIVKETGWSDAKVSQLLSSMADNGRVEKLRLGRENLISLPDEDEREE
ncbi:helix-turn-helix transcriptional regulator [Haloferax sp. YSMS24]|uniref:helix-turn-helix transcriptional regulator n=1 Tax=Haloferax sp. YSMS24 TaxID=3388425 RepID=UPI00398CAA9E